MSIKLAPNPEQHAALVATLERFNAACDAIAEVAYREHLANRIALQKLVYYAIRERFGLSSQMTVRAIAKVVEAYKRDKTIQPTFRPHGALTYHERIMSWKGVEHVSLQALDGRHRRRNLQRRQTRSAKRKLQSLRRKQARFQRDSNHCISKALVRTAKDTARGIAFSTRARAAVMRPNADQSVSKVAEWEHGSATPAASCLL